MNELFSKLPPSQEPEKTVQVHFKVARHLFRAVQDRARAMSVPMSTVYKMALDEYLKSHK
jgi:hypothetical protein